MRGDRGLHLRHPQAADAAGMTAIAYAASPTGADILRETGVRIIASACASSPRLPSCLPICAWSERPQHRGRTNSDPDGAPSV